MDSMFLTPENDVFFQKSEFYSDLKQKAVGECGKKVLSFYMKHSKCKI